LEPRHVGETQGHVQLGQRIGVVTFLEEVRASIGADPDRLHHVARPLGVLERSQIVHVVPGPVTIHRRHHGKHGVGRRQRPGVVRLTGQRQRLVGKGLGLVTLTA
jgi:hypothetical protein